MGAVKRHENVCDGAMNLLKKRSRDVIIPNTAGLVFFSHVNFSVHYSVIHELFLKEEAIS